MKYEPLPELDSSLPDNDMGAMIGWIALTLTVFAIVLWSLK